MSGRNPTKTKKWDVTATHALVANDRSDRARPSSFKQVLPAGADGLAHVCELPELDRNIGKEI